MTQALKDKIIESLTSILPIALIIIVLSMTFTPLGSGTFVLFMVGVVLLILGLGCFTLGADMSMLVIGEKIGSAMTHSRKIWLIALLSFVIGIIVTIAEPDLQILAEQVPAVAEKVPQLGNYLLIITVAVGVGIFLTVAMLRIVLRIRLSVLLIIFYVAAFILSIFVSDEFWAVSFDSGGVTTGPMTVPFIMSLGVGVASIRSDKNGQDDSFGLVALSSVGPIVAVLTLGIVFDIKGVEYEVTSPAVVENTQDVLFQYLHGFGDYALEVLIALSPILAFFLLFQLVSRSFHKKQIIRIFMGFLYTFMGLVLFLTGANVGFMPVGSEIGKTLAALWDGWMLIPVGMIIGYFVVSAEPAVHVLNKQVERVSAGAISSSAMKKGLCIGVCCAIGLAMLRILLDVNIMYFLIPGYVIALGLTFFTPPMFTGIAFDSGGVASGAMVSSFVLPMAIGACSTLQGTGSVMTLAFGCVSFVALAPLISIQILGIVYRRKTHKIKRNFLAVEDRIVEYEVL
ncbi:MAG TPA: DUF1538 domain-containing protein [Candidatus Gallimonas intestinavium]|uniref:DUF1538 domain-containing protein n=1 Tax=Candidatus Gallimonas intestinavium TaxID=2838603 RepID=A0A9D2G3Y4_9FIRM|nr:DUF1538 domain-containing protein [Candidatus Gallimonas intestinavium]